MKTLKIGFVIMSVGIALLVTGITATYIQSPNIQAWETANGVMSFSNMPVGWYIIISGLLTLIAGVMAEFFLIVRFLGSDMEAKQ